MGRSLRLGALVVLVLSLQLSNYCSLAQPPGSSAQGNVGQGEGAGSKNGPTESSPAPTPSPTTPTTEPSGDPSPGLGSGAPPMGPAGGKGGQLSPQEKRALAEKEALDEERNEVSEFKERYASRRHWRGFCLCSSNMFTHSPDDSFVTSCFEDLTSACFYQGFEVPLENQTDGIFSYELCHLLTTVEEGSISSEFLSLLDYEVKQKCKHPYKTRSDEFLTFFRDFIKPPPPVMELLEQRNFDGAMFSELTASEAQYIGLPLEFYTGMLSTRDYLIVSGRTVPYTEERQGPADISKVEASVQVNDVFDINEKDFTFSAAFTLSFAWTDANMWSECSGENDELDSGECQWVWRPEVSGVGSGLVSSVLLYLLTRLSHYSLSWRRRRRRRRKVLLPEWQRQPRGELQEGEVRLPSFSVREEWMSARVRCGLTCNSFSSLLLFIFFILTLPPVCSTPRKFRDLIEAAKGGTNQSSCRDNLCKIETLPGALRGRLTSARHHGAGPTRARGTPA